MRQQFIIQASFVKDDGTQFIIFYLIFSRLLVIFSCRDLSISMYIYIPTTQKSGVHEF